MQSSFVTCSLLCLSHDIHEGMYCMTLKCTQGLRHRQSWTYVKHMHSMIAKNDVVCSRLICCCKRTRVYSTPCRETLPDRVYYDTTFDEYQICTIVKNDRRRRHMIPHMMQTCSDPWSDVQVQSRRHRTLRSCDRRRGYRR